jgi:hypothetical protein
MSFSVTGGTPALGSVVGDASCVTDWITILCATNTMNPAAQSGAKIKVHFLFQFLIDFFTIYDFN